MGFKCGIVGLPNVGKSTLFNALTKTQAAQAANYPFCTIEPNVGEVEVPDTRLDTIGRIAKSQNIVPTRLTFVDIAGLVEGASSGEGLGNRFLAHIREVDAIAVVLRCFADDNITHVAGHVDPLADAQTIETELMLADLESLERRIEGLTKRARGNDKDAKTMLALVEQTIAHLGAGEPARGMALEEGRIRDFATLQLLSAKPVVYVCNVDENAAVSGNTMSAAVHTRAQMDGAQAIVISAALEEQLAGLEEDEQAEYLAALGLSAPGLNQVISAGYTLLELITFFTCGPKEARAWTVRKGSLAPRAARAIHTDFEKGFIRAETIAYDDFVACGGEAGAKEAGRMRLEGKDYVVCDGDVMHFRFAT